MPNWCSNIVTLSHKDKKKMAALLTELNKGEDSAQIFNVLRKRPKSQEDNWYEWNLSHWGTKWDSNVNGYEDNDDNIWVSFETPWGAPIALYEYLIKKGWSVEAYYSEPGLQFCGSWIDGEEDYYEYGDIIGDLKKLKKIPSDIYEFADLEYQHEEYMEYLKEQEDGV